MAMETVRLGGLEVGRVILGGNPFSGFSHQGPQRDQEMRRYYTVARIKETMRQAEALGVTAHIGRTDAHVLRTLLEYWGEGGRIQWIAQTAPELGIDRSIANAIGGGARACYIHGGVVDHLLANGQMDQIPPAIERIRAAGLVTGIAGHDPGVFEWAEAHALPVDFYMCCYYNSTPRQRRAEHVSSTQENFDPADRDRMVAVIRRLSRPVIHYKVFAAGRNDPSEALAFTARHLRPQDAVCVGICTQHKPDMLAENLRLLEQHLAQRDAQPA